MNHGGFVVFPWWCMHGSTLKRLAMTTDDGGGDTIRTTRTSDQVRKFAAFRGGHPRNGAQPDDKGRQLKKVNKLKDSCHGSTSRLHEAEVGIRETRAGKRCVVAAGLVLCLTAGSALAAPVTVDKETNMVIQAAGAAAGRIPYVGAVLSMATKLIFGEEKQPGYAEMKVEWEGYTDKRILESKIATLKDKLSGYRELLIKIDQLTASEIADRAQGLTIDRHKEKAEKWKNLSDQLTTDLPLFESDDNEPAAPLLPMFAAVANLQINVLDQQIILIRNFDSLEIKNEQLVNDNLRNATNDRARLIGENNVRMKTQITKAAEERRSQVQFHEKKVELEDPKKLSTSRTFYDVYWVTELKHSSKEYTRKGEAETIYNDRCNVVYGEVVHNAELLYLRRETTTLKVDLIHTDVTDDKFRSMFERFGTVKMVGLVYQQGDENNYATRKMIVGSTNSWQPISPGWHTVGTGYVEMDTPDALEAMAYWSSPAGKARARGETGLNKELLTYVTEPGGLLVQEDRMFNPWEWQMR